MCRKSVILISSLITIYFLNSINAFELNRIQIFENDFEEERELSSINVQNFSMINNFREFFKENEKSDDKDSNKLCDFHLNKTFEGIKNLETWALECEYLKRHNIFVLQGYDIIYNILSLLCENLKWIGDMEL